MATANRKSDIANVVDASCEIVIDALYMTTDTLHSIRNNLPVSFEEAQLVLRKVETDELPGAVAAPSRRSARWAVAAVGVVAMTLGAMEIARAVDTVPPAPASPKVVMDLPSPVEQARAALQDGKPGVALSTIEFAVAQGFDGTDLRKARIDALMALDRHSEARSEALRGVADGLGPDFVTAYRAGLEQDPMFQATPAAFAVELVDETEVRGDRLVVTMDGVERTLDVATTEDSAWAAQLSAYRLCMAIECAFELPEVQHVTLDRKTAQRLGLDPETLDWRYDETSDGESVELVDGALTDVRTAAGNFPVEYTRTWRNLLSAEVDESVLDAPFAATIEPLAGKEDWAARVVANRGETSSRAFGRQVGSMLVFDFLTNNYKRFERRAANYGSNVGWDDGHLVSADHRAAFAERNSRRVSDRMNWMTRLPAETATAVQLLAPETVDERVLIGLSDRQREVFWSQHQTFVERVQDLEKKHGRSQVLSL